MNKTDIISLVGERAKLNKAQADRAVNALLDGIGEALARGESVTVTGFGTFELRERPARDIVDPRDPSKTLHVEAHKAVGFKPGALLKKQVAGE